jgi:hypothetical protein
LEEETKNSELQLERLAEKPTDNRKLHIAKKNIRKWKNTLQFYHDSSM